MFLCGTMAHETYDNFNNLKLYIFMNYQSETNNLKNRNKKSCASREHERQDHT